MKDHSETNMLHRIAQKVQAATLNVGMYEVLYDPDHSMIMMDYAYLEPGYNIHILVIIFNIYIYLIRFNLKSGDDYKTRFAYRKTFQFTTIYANP